MNNMELIGCRLGNAQGRTLDEILAFLLKHLHPDLENFKPTSFDFRCLFGVFQRMYTLHHLGASQSMPPKEISSIAREKILQCFATDWYLGNSRETERMSKNPSSHDFSMEWKTIFERSFWLALMTDDEECLRMLADWVESWFKVGVTVNEPDETLVGQILISVAAAFRTSPLEGKEEMESQILKSRKRSHKTVFQAWDAARKKDQKGFESALLKSVEDFRKRQDEEVILLEILPVPQAIVLAAARKLGMQLPDYPPEIAAYLPTPESVGMSPPKLWAPT